LYIDQQIQDQLTSYYNNYELPKDDTIVPKHVGGV